MKAGEPDIRLYFDAGRIVFVEMKGEGGSLNKDQRERIPKLYALGFTVHVVKAATPDEAVELVRAIVEAERSTFMGSAVLATRWMPK